MTAPAARFGSPATSSATPSGQGSSIEAYPSTSCNACSATPAPRWSPFTRTHDSTVREAFEKFCSTRIDIDGRRLPYSTEDPTSEAEWIKHHLSRIRGQRAQRVLRPAAPAGLPAS